MKCSHGKRLTVGNHAVIARLSSSRHGVMCSVDAVVTHMNKRSRQETENRPAEHFMSRTRRRVLSDTADKSALSLLARRLGGQDQPTKARSHRHALLQPLTTSPAALRSLAKKAGKQAYLHRSRFNTTLSSMVQRRHHSP